MPHLKSRMKSIISCLTFVSCFSTVHATTFSIEDQIKSIEYGANPHFNASVKIVDISPFTLNKFVSYMALPEFSLELCHDYGMKFTEEQLLHMRGCIRKTGGSEKFLLENQDKIKCDITSELITLTLEEGIFEPQYNLSTVQFPTWKSGGISTATIIDVQSIGLPLELQRRVFLTCTHQFRDNFMKEEIPASQLDQQVVEVARENSSHMIHTPVFKRHKIESLFYAQERDIAFGILDTPVDEHVTPLSLIMEPLKFEKEKFITIAGYGRASIWSNDKVSDYIITDNVKRAGHMMIKEYQMMNNWNENELVCYDSVKMFNMPIEKTDLISHDSVILRGNPGHSGSGGLIWNISEKKFQVIGVYLGVQGCGDCENIWAKELGVDEKQYDNLENYRQAIEGKISSEHEGKVILYWNIPDTVNSHFSWEVINGKMLPDHLIEPKERYIDIDNYDTFFNYSEKMKETFLGMKKRSKRLNDYGRFIIASPYALRFIEKFKELDYLKTNAKGVYKI